MRYSFTCFGHENTTARHKTTLEFTKEEHLGLEGDCIVGVKADFSLPQLKEFIKNLHSKKITIIIKTIKNEIIEKINAEINPNFDDDKEMVIRKTDFISGRTLAIKADKAAFGLNRDLIEFLRKKENQITIILEAKS